LQDIVDGPAAAEGLITAAGVDGELDSDSYGLPASFLSERDLTGAGRAARRCSDGMAKTAAIVNCDEQNRAADRPGNVAARASQ
jgi:hypothetical protein